VAAALACTATAAVAAGPLALVAAAVAAALAVAWPAAAPDGLLARARPRPAWGPAAEGSPDADDPRPLFLRPSAGEDDGSTPPADTGADPADARTLPAWTVALAAVPAGALALDAAAGRSPTAALAVAALAAAAGGLTIVDRDRDHDEAGLPAVLPVGAWPAAALAAVVLVLPGRIGWVGDPLPHWPVGVGFAALGAALAIVLLGRRQPTDPAAAPAEGASPPPKANAPAEPAKGGRRRRRKG